MPENYILLERIELNASVSSVALNNIPQTGYTDLKIVCSTRTDYAGFLDLNMFLNGNASSGYSWRRLNGDGGSATSTNSTSAGVIPSPTLGTTATANTFASTEIYIPNYTSTTSKSVSIDGVTENNATTSYQSFTAGLSTLSTAITSVNFGLGAGNFVAGSTFSLYGIAALGTTPVIAPKAIGGNRIDNDGTYWYHTYTSSGSFTPLQGISCDYLVVAGGGGGGNWQNSGGGGGAGGLRSATSQALTTTSYAVTVGAGGTGGAYQTPGGKGTNSSLNSLTSTGGGGGGSGFSSSAGNATTGGSGGGGWSIDPSTTTSGAAGNQGGYSPVEGYAGGDGSIVSSFGFSGAGGGAGAVGQTGSAGGAGGVGSSAFSSWGLATTTGQNVSGTVFYAGGGGGGRDIRSGGSPGAGGNGGGGQGGGGASQVTAANGTANTGGGAGGQGNDAIPTTVRSGGSGIVIIRYTIA
jgi:hypothetical protein